MTKRFIDLRSDTVTRPTERMRRAMAEAEVGDDVYHEDPTVNRLEARAAEIFGREAALFVPSGSMGNLVCICTHTSPGREVICERSSHVYNFELGSMAAVAGVTPMVVDGVGGVMSWESIEQAIRPPLDHYARTSLLCLENTHNMAGGTVWPVDQFDDVCERARKRGLSVHLDGARIFNAAVALGRPVAEITRGVDSMSVCLSKGLGAPVGSLAIGSRDFIREARQVRKMLGGGMRQAGVLAAAGLIALEESPARLHEDHDNARLLAGRLAEVEGVSIDAESVRTNVLFFDVSGTGMDAYTFVGRLISRGVQANPMGPARIRLITHCDVSREDVLKAADLIGEIAGNAA